MKCKRITPALLRSKRRFALFAALVLLASMIGFGTGAAASSVDNTDADITALLAAGEEDQGLVFSDLVFSRMKYVTSRSLCAKKGEWLAFVDIFEEYEDGAPLGQYILQKGTLQYGLQPLPDNAKTSTMTVGSRAFYCKAEKQSMFTFRTSPPLELPSSAQEDVIRMSVTAGKQNTSITLDQRYPHRDFEDIEYVLQQMAPVYLDYAEKRDGSFDHAFLRLRSYVTDTENLGRAYSWELTLVAKSTLPSKGIVIRYDCATGQVAEAANREIRSYFG